MWSAALICFEIWGVWIRVKKNSNFRGKFPKSFDFFQAILQRNFDFSKQISENLQAISQKIPIFPGSFSKKLIFSGNFTKNFNFSRQISKRFRFLQPIFSKISIFQGKIGHLQLLLGKLFYFSSKVTTLEHTSCTSSSSSSSSLTKGPMPVGARCRSRYSTPFLFLQSSVVSSL